MSGIVGGLNTRGSGLILSSATDGQVLTATGAGMSTGFEAAAGGGKVLQALGATDSTGRSTSSSSWVTASNTLSVDITPAGTGSKFFISVSSGITQGAGVEGFYTIFRDSTNLGHATYGFTTNIIFNSTAFNTNIAFSYLDSPSASSEITYQVYIKTGSSVTLNQNSCKGSISVIEIGA